MRIFGFEIRRYRPEPVLTPEQRLIAACTAATTAWKELLSATGYSSLRPWVDWANREVNVVEYTAELRPYSASEDTLPVSKKTASPQKPRGLKLRNGMYTGDLK